MSRSNLFLFLTLSSSSGLTWITESRASRKKKRVRKSVIHADADRHGAPRRSSSDERDIRASEREIESEREVRRGELNLVKVRSTWSRLFYQSTSFFYGIALYAMAPRFGRLVWLFPWSRRSGPTRAVVVSPSFTVLPWQLLGHKAYYYATIGQCINELGNRRNLNRIGLCFYRLTDSTDILTNYLYLFFPEFYIGQS